MSSTASTSSTPTPADNNHNPGRTLPESVRWAVEAFVKYQTAEGSVDTVDVYRCIREQANLMYERQLLLDAIQSDPFRQFEDVRTKLRNMKDRLDVTSCSRTLTWEGYALIQATVHLSKPAKATTPSFSLQFRYERQPSQNKVWYSIDLVADLATTNHSTSVDPPLGSRRVLEIEVWTVGSRGPSVLPARPIEMDDVDEEEDGLEDDENHEDMEVEADDVDGHHDGGTKTNGSRIPTETNHKKKNKPNPTPDAPATTTVTTKAKTNNRRMQVEEDADGPNTNEDENQPNNDEDDDDDDDDSQLLSSDRYAACLDPDILSDFIEWTHLQPMPDVTAFFLLMTFPYYELEWDLIGMVLESAFDDDEEDHEEEDDEKHAMHDDKAGHHGESKSDDEWDDDDDEEEEEEN